MTFVANAVLLAAIYLLCAGQFQAHELLLAALFGVATAALAATASRAAPRRLGLRPAWFRVFVPVPVMLVSDSVKVGAVMPRPLPGGLRQESLDAGGGAPVGRRGLAILARSVAPNAYVIRATGNRVVVHELVGGPPSTEQAT